MNSTPSTAATPLRRLQLHTVFIRGIPYYQDTAGNMYVTKDIVMGNPNPRILVLAPAPAGAAAPAPAPNS